MSSIDFDTAWTRAEQTVYRRLVKTTATEDKKTAFLGYLPAVVPAWAFFTGRGGNNEQTLWTPEVVSIHLQAEIRSVWTDRAKAQEFVMRVIRAQLQEPTENVQAFRIRMGGLQEIRPDILETGNEAKKILVFVADIGCELVFSTGAG